MRCRRDLPPSTPTATACSTGSISAPSRASCTRWRWTLRGTLVRFAGTGGGSGCSDQCRVDGSEWVPYRIFDTGGRPIYYPPQVVYVAAARKYALAFGTGDREDLQHKSNQNGRFYFIRDDFTSASTMKTETNYTLVTTDGSNVQGDLVAGSGGYYIPLLPDERLLSEVFTLGPVTIFSTFDPNLGPQPNNVNPCASGSAGRSRVYVLGSANGNSLRSSGRNYVIEGLVTNPFVQSSSNVQSKKDPDEDPAPARDAATSKRSTKIVRP